MYERGVRGVSDSGKEDCRDGGRLTEFVTRSSLRVHIKLTGMTGLALL